MKSASERYGEEPLMAVQVVVLDFDGVILESNDLKTECFREVFSRFPLHLDAMMDFHHENVSASRFVKFDHLVRARLQQPEGDELIAELAEHFSDATMRRMADVPFVAGAEAFLKELHGRVPLYLASVTPQRDLEEILDRRGLRVFFRDVYGCPPWTKTAAIQHLIEREQCAAGSVVLVGDSPGDMRAANESGIEFIARDSGITFDPPPSRCHADLHGVASFLRPRVP